MVVKKRKTSTVRPARPRNKRVAFEDQTVGDVLSTRVQAARLDTKGDDLAALFVKGPGPVMIVDKSKHLLGVVSEQDLLLSLDEGQQWSALSAKEIMSENPYSVPPETNLSTFVHVLTESDLISVPVVNAENRLVGIVTRRDVVRAALRRGAGRQARGRA